MEHEILNKINSAQNILIITHVNPDGDTLGSASALKSYIGDKADILIQIQDNFQFPSIYYFLPHINQAKNFSTLEDKYDLIFALDCASKDRIIDKARILIDKCDNTIAIDHHKTNKGYANLNLVRGGISSTGEVLYDFFKALNVCVTKEMAIGLYSAILTDTGCFKYESTTSHTFEIASELSQTGINTSEIADLCYTNKPKNMVLFQSYLVSNAVFCMNDQVAYTIITKDIQDKYQAKDEYTEGICETLRSIANIELAFVIKETDVGSKVSIRTKKLDATQVVSRFNGGGHRRAAGCTIKEKPTAACEMLLKTAKEML